MSAISAACPICHDPLITSVTLSCDHKVHRACMRKFAKTNEGCPECNLSARVVTRSTAPEAVAKAAEEVILTQIKGEALKIWKRDDDYLQNLHNKIRQDRNLYMQRTLPEIEPAPTTAKEWRQYIEEKKAYDEVINMFGGCYSYRFDMTIYFRSENPIFRKMILILTDKIKGNAFQLVSLYLADSWKIKCFTVDELCGVFYVAARFGRSRELSWLKDSEATDNEARSRLMDIGLTTCQAFKQKTDWQGQGFYGGGFFDERGCACGQCGVQMRGRDNN